MYDIHMEETTEEFFMCWRAAAMHIDRLGTDKTFRLLKSELSPPYLEHLSFALGNQLFFLHVVDVDEAVQLDEVVDIFKQAGLDKPDISILSDEFLAELKDMPQKNLALETFKRLLQEEVSAIKKKNIVQAKIFSARLEEAVLRYQNRDLEAAQVIAELIDLAKTMREAGQRGSELGLGEDEVASYDALADNPSAIEIGDDTLKQIARELVAIQDAIELLEHGGRDLHGPFLSIHVTVHPRPLSRG